ncbi:hypothetical protein STAN_3870 [Streptomyces sp. CBMAI 2042]|nr:hypothetical protein STAN_3870 [Streptomyces sp. CBMAI 2042]
MRVHVHREVRWHFTGSPNTLSRTMTGSTVVSNATTWPGRWTITCPFFDGSSAERA